MHLILKVSRYIVWVPPTPNPSNNGTHRVLGYLIASPHWIKIDLGYQQMHKGPYIAVYNQANRIYFDKMMPKYVTQDFAFFSIYFFCNCSSLRVIEFLQKTQYASRNKIKPVLGTESRVWLIISYPGTHDNVQINMGTQALLDTKPRKVLLLKLLMPGVNHQQPTSAN